MKVLMFGWEFPPHISGGLGTACYGLARGLTSFDDIELTFVVPRLYGHENKKGIKLIAAGEFELSGEKIKKQEEIEKSLFHEFNKPCSAYITPEQFEEALKEKHARSNEAHTNITKKKLEFTGEYGTGLFEEISRYGVIASEIAKKESHDVIHAHDWLTYIAGIQAKEASGKPLVVHVHATEFDRCGENINERVYGIEQKGMEIADKVIAVSDYTRNIVIRKYNITPSKVVTIHNAVEPANNDISKHLYKMGTNDKIVTFLGRITRQKGPEYFIAVACKVLQKMDNVRFVMAGGGDLYEKMIRDVARLRISDKFHFTGFLRGDDVYRMYAMSNLYIMPSVSEPFGISPLEAIQSGVPVIISKQSGVSEVITNTIKVDYWDIDAMADAVYGILNYQVLSEYIRNKSYQEVSKIKWTYVAAKVKDIYCQLAYAKAG